MKRRPAKNDSMTGYKLIYHVSYTIAFGLLLDALFYLFGDGSWIASAIAAGLTDGFGADLATFFGYAGNIVLMLLAVIFGSRFEHRVVLRERKRMQMPLVMS